MLLGFFGGNRSQMFYSSKSIVTLKQYDSSKSKMF